MLVRSKIIDESDSGIYTPGFVQIKSQHFDLLALPDRLQFSPNLDANGGEAVRQKLCTLVRTLPHTPYTAMGMNFTWHTQPLGSDIGRKSRSLFFNEAHPLRDDFNDGDPRFGGYCSKTIFGMRLKLTMLPAINTSKPTEDFLQLAFNYHLDVTPASAVDVISESLNKWNDAQNYATNLALKIKDAI